MKILARVFALLGTLVALVLAGCASPTARPLLRTHLDPGVEELPATLAGNHLVVRSQWDKRGPWHFLIDTGASITLVSPAFAQAYATDQATVDVPPVRVASADGRLITLGAVRLRRLQLGEARFDHVPALVYDCEALSAHLGVTIDGILGFPLFRDTRLTLDYPRSRVLIGPADADSLVPGVPVPFDNDRHIPLIPVQLGERTFTALVDSGSDGPLHLNPYGLNPVFLYGPKPGATIGTLAGDRLQEIGRLAGSVRLGPYTFVQPIVDLTDALSSIGGEVLRHFTVTFDQTKNQVSFYRESTAPIFASSRRSAGLSFQKGAAYWKVVGIVPGSPADELGLQTGDLVIRIDGQPVALWNLNSYDERVRTAAAIEFVFLHGRNETPVRIATFDLVP